jgi:hypothetical protein
MTATEIKNRIESIVKYQNRHLKSATLNICDEMLRVEFLSEKEKEKVQEIKIKIQKTKDPWLWNNKPSFVDMKEITENVNELWRMLK